jgi:hypothetical protein
MRIGALLAVLVFAAACARETPPSPAAEPVSTPPAASPAPAPKPEEPATVRGTVRWTGVPMEPIRISMTGDEFSRSAWPEGGPLDPRFEVGEGGALPHTFVWASKGPHEGRTWAVPSQWAELAGERSMFVPHVLGVRCGQPLALTSRDGGHYNFHAHPAVNRNEINMCVARDVVYGPNHSPLREKDVNVVRFEIPEAAIPIAGDVLSWMSAYVFVLDHPFFATTDAQGRFEIRGLPPGDYVFRVWHEPMQADVKVHQTETKVTLAPGASATVDIELR